MQMIYGVKDRPKAGRLILFALQQLLAILAATITVPIVVNANNPEAHMSISAALFGAGVGTLVYLLFTKFRSPVFLGSSFAFLNSMIAAFAGATTATLGYLGILLGAVFAGLIYVIIAVVVKFAGVKWIDKIMPAVVIGPTVAIIGLSLAGSAIGQLAGGVKDSVTGAYTMDVRGILCVICGLVTLATTIACSVYGKKMLKMIPFVMGILAGYVMAAIFTAFSYIPGAESMRIIGFEYYFNVKNIEWYPDFAFIKLFGGDYGDKSLIGAYIGTIAVAYIPVAFVTFAEHLADHKNISSIKHLTEIIRLLEVKGVMTHSEMVEELHLRHASTLTEIMKKVAELELVDVRRAGKYNLYSLTDAGVRYARQMRAGEDRQNLLKKIKSEYGIRRSEASLDSYLQSADEGMSVKPGQALKIKLDDTRPQNVKVEAMMKEISYDEEIEYISFTTKAAKEKKFVYEAGA